MRAGLRTGLAAILAAASLLGLAACAPASPVFPGMPAVVASPAPSPAAADGDAGGSGSVRPGAPARAEDGAFVFGTGPTQVDIWVDFFCPYCRMFEDSSGDYLRDLVDDGAVTLRIHPIAFLDRASMGTRYSTRAANAFACVADAATEDETLDYFRTLYAIQPEEGTPGLTSDELAGPAPAAAEDCILELRHDAWVGEWTDRAVDAGVRGTPTVLVDGEPFPGHPSDGAAFRDFLELVTGTAESPATAA